MLSGPPVGAKDIIQCGIRCDCVLIHRLLNHHWNIYKSNRPIQKTVNRHFIGGI